MNSFKDNHTEITSTNKRSKLKIWNKLMIKLDKNGSSKFNNFGFHHIHNDKKVSLLTTDEADRYQIQMYDHIIQKEDIYYKDILEISSGKGGGAAYINKYYTPKSYTAIDASSRNINFCNSNYNEPCLKFIKSEYLNIPFENELFDFIINIESAKNNVDFPKFLDEIYRVLKYKGVLLFADIIETNNVETIKHYLRMGGFTIEHKQDITQNVIKALEINLSVNKEIETAKSKLNNESKLYNSFVSGKLKYMSFTLKKVS